MQELIQSLIDMLTESIMYQEKLITKAQKLGLQAEKREVRLAVAEDLNLLHYIKCYSLDRWGFELEGKPTEKKVSPIGKFEDFFNIYKKFLEEKQAKMAEMVNKMYGFGAYRLGDCVKKRVLSLDSEIVDINRDILEGRNTQWNAHAIYTRHVTAENKHDTYEHKEKDNGYEY